MSICCTPDIAEDAYRMCEEEGLLEDPLMKPFCEAARAYLYLAGQGEEIDVRKAVEELGAGAVSRALGPFAGREKVPKRPALMWACSYLLREMARLLK